jgi:cob(I)alamin adenosyltransferase
MARIYTKTGDKGETSLLGGKRVPKDHLRIQAYGTVDELNSWIGLLYDQEMPDSAREVLRKIQDHLFCIGSVLAADPANPGIQTPTIGEDDIAMLEKEIDRMTGALPPLKAFILPGGHPVASHCHIARCVCRRAERHTVTLAAQSPVNAVVIRYLNRLSDYLFTLARHLLDHFKIQAVEWSPRMRGA